MALRTSPFPLPFILRFLVCFVCKAIHSLMGIKITGNTRGLRQTSLCVTVSHLFLFYSVIHTHVQTHIMYTYKQARGGVGRLSDNTLDFKSAPGRVYAPLAAIVGYAPHVLYVYFSHTFPADWRSFLLLLCCPPPTPLRRHPRRRRRFLLLTLLLAVAALPPVCGC